MRIFSLFGEILLRDNGASSQIDKIAGAAKKLGGLLVGGLGLKELAEKSFEFAQSASDIVEAQNVVESTFKTSGKAIEEWTDTTAKSAGISKTSSMQWAGFMGAMLKSSGVSEESSASMSKNLVQLTGDMSSFYNVSTSDMWEKLRSGISGETEPLKAIGINMSVANLQAYALAEGIKKPYAQMTQGEQTQLRYNYLMNATKDAQGDFGKTLEGSFANQLRVAQLNLADLGRSIGTKLLPGFMSGVSWINQHMPQIESTVSKVTKGVGDAIGIVVPKFQEWGKLIGQIATELLPSFGGSTVDAQTKVTALAQNGLNFVTSALTWIRDNIGIVEAGVVALTSVWVIQQGVLLAHNIALVAHNVVQGVKMAQDLLETGYIVALYVAQGIHNGIMAAGTVAQLALNVATGAFGVIMAVVTSPIFLVIAALVALGVGIYEIVKHWDVISAKTKEVWNNIVSSVSGAVGNVKNAIVNGFTIAIDWIKALPAQALTWGSDFIDGFKNGIMSAMGRLLDSVKAVANNIKSFLHFSVPDQGPLADYETWMPDFMEGLAKGIDANKYKVIDSIKGLTGNVKVSANLSTDGKTSQVAQVAQAPNITHNIYTFGNIVTPNVDDFSAQLRALARLT